MKPTGKSYIGNELRGAGSTKFRTVNPQQNEFNDWECIEATEDEVFEAVSLAHEAFKKYRRTTNEERANFLNSIAIEIESLGESLIDIFCSESGLSEERALIERTRTTFQLRTFAALLLTDSWRRTSIDEALPERKPLPRVDLRKTMIPLGPIAVFGASNFPLAYSTAGGDTASALAAGCPVVVKSHPMHAGTGELVASAIIKAAQNTRMPNGVFSNLNSKGFEISQQLVLSSAIKGVGFTGSITGGRAIFDLANSRPEPIPVFAEMGSINPVIITEKSLAVEGEKWAETYANSITLGTGQFCTNPGLILAIDSPSLNQFSNLLAEKIIKVSPSCMLHPNIKNAYSTLKNEITDSEGVQTLTTGLETPVNYADQTIVAVSGKAFLENSKMHQEVFGPFSMIVRCSDKNQLLEIVETLEGQLTGTIVAQPDEVNEIQDLVDVLQHRVGRIIFNGVPTGVEVCASMQHGGPYPASTDSRFTAVGPRSIERWIRPISYQNFPNELLPQELRK